MDPSDIERRATSSYMISVSERAAEEDRRSLNEFMEKYRSIDITVNEDSDEVRDMVEEGVDDPDVAIVVHRFDEMDEDMQRFLAQYLKGIAEKYTDVPIVVFDEEGGNLGMANPDLTGRVYSL